MSTDARVAPSYSYSFNTSIGDIFDPLMQVVKVSGDLWFLPQWQVHLLWVGALALAVAGSVVMRQRGTPPSAAGEEEPALAYGGSSLGSNILVIALCLALAASPIIGSSGGFVTYRTLPAPCSVAAVVMLFCVRVIVVSVSRFIVPAATSAAAARIEMALTAGAAIFGNYYANYLDLMRLARNEFGHFTAIAHRAMEAKAQTVLLVDPRPFGLPEDHPVVEDQKGRPIPPYELGCLSSYCVQSGAILQIAAQVAGAPRGTPTVNVNRGGYPVPGLTCDLLTAPGAPVPPDASKQTLNTLAYFRRLPSLMCVTYDLSWQDLSVDLAR